MQKISHQAFMIVTLLLVFETVFVGIYFTLLAKAEENSVRQQRSREIIATTNQLLDSMYLAGDNVSKSVFHPEQASKSAYESAMKSIPEKLTWLHQHVEPESSQQALLARIDSGTHKSVDMLVKLHKVSETQEPVIAMQYGLKMRSKMQKHLESLVRDFIEFLNTEKKIESLAPLELKESREQQKWLLVVGLGANIFAAVAAALFFVRNLTSRLEIVVNNSQKLLARQPLHHPLGGSDELSQLDRAFHFMSSSLMGEEELLKANEVQLRAIIDQMPVSLMIVDESNVIEYANPALSKLLGIKEGTVPSARFSDYFSKNLSSIESANGSINMQAVRADGKVLDVEFAYVDVQLAEQSRRLAVVSDVTERNALQKMKQAFVAMVSHELRTPLTSVSGYLQLLPMGVYGELSGQAVEAVSQTEAQVEQLIMLINDLLDLEKLQAGKMELSRSRIKLEEVIDEAFDSVFAVADARAAELLFDGCELDVYADKERLRQAFGKILTCLLRLGDEEQKIEVSVQTDSSQNATVKFCSKRISIASDDLALMFEPFHRIQSGRDRALGLGLTLSRAIATQMGGECGADTTAGGGTCLWLSLPAAS